MQEVRIGVVPTSSAHGATSASTVCNKHSVRWTEKTRIEVEWLPYEFNPDIPRAGIDRETYCVAQIPARWPMPTNSTPT